MALSNDSRHNSLNKSHAVSENLSPNEHMRNALQKKTDAEGIFDDNSTTASLESTTEETSEKTPSFDTNDIVDEDFSEESPFRPEKRVNHRKEQEDLHPDLDDYQIEEIVQKSMVSDEITDLSVAASLELAKRNHKKNVSVQERRKRNRYEKNKTQNSSDSVSNSSKAASKEQKNRNVTERKPEKTVNSKNSKSGNSNVKASDVKSQKASKSAFIHKAIQTIKNVGGSQIDTSDTINNNVEKQVISSAKSTAGLFKVGSTALWGVITACLPATVVVIVVAIIAVMLFQLKPIDDLKTLKDTVYLVEQNYKAELISEKTEYFDIDANVPVNYHGLAISWKQLLCFWYVTGCDVTSEDSGENSTFYESMDVSTVSDTVENTILSKDEMDSLTDCFNTLNTIFSYPSREIADQQITSAVLSEEDIENLDSNTTYNAETHTLTTTSYQDTLQVDIESITASEAAKCYSNRDNYDYILDHIDRCIRSIDEDNPDLEPVFYAMWHGVKDTTSIDVNGRDLLIKEALAIWLMTGCNGELPESQFTEFLDEENGTEGKKYVFEYTFYRNNNVGGTGARDLPWTFKMEFPCDSEGNFSMYDTVHNGYQISYINEMDTVPFLDENNGDGLSYSYDYGTGEYSRNVIYNGMETHRTFKYSGVCWQTYCYRCIGSSSTGAWCDAFVNSLAQNFYPGGCFFKSQKFFMNSEHGGWEEWEEGMADEEPETFLETLANNCQGVSLGSLPLFISEFYNTYEEYYANTASTSFLNVLKLEAETDYYRINLMNTPSEMYYGLENDYTDNGRTFRPSDTASDEYRPDEEELDFLCSNPDTSFGDQDYESPSNSTNYEGVDISVPCHDGSQDKGFVTNAGQNDSGYHTGHLKGWYAPQLSINCAFGENMDLGTAYQLIGALYYCSASSTIQEKVDFIINKASYIYSGILDASVSLTGSLFGSDAANWISENFSENDLMKFRDIQNSINRLMYYNCGIFGEIQEEQQGLFMDCAYCPTNLSWYSNQGLSFAPSQAGDLYDVDAGDVVFYDWGPSDGVSDHVGLVIAVSGDYVYTIEGNTGNGTISDTIAVHSRSRSDANICDFVAIPYGAGAED